MPNVPLPRGKRYRKSRKLPASHGGQRWPAESGQATGLLVVVGPSWEGGWYQISRACFLPAEVLRYPEIHFAIPELQREPGPEGYVKALQGTEAKQSALHNTELC